MGCSTSVPVDQSEVAKVIVPIFDHANTTYKFTEQEVDADILRELVRLTNLAPTAFNCGPLRYTFATTQEAKDKIAAFGQWSNKDNTAVAPAVAVLSLDKEWINQMDKLCPAYGGVEGIRGALGNSEDAINHTGELNAHIQVGYFILAARALGLGAGPMTGFDFAGLKEALQTEHEPLVVVRLGYAAENPEYKRGARLSFEEVATLNVVAAPKEEEAAAQQE